MQEILDYCLSHYWMGVIVAFLAIFILLKIFYVTDFKLKFRKEHYLFLVLSFLSWLVPALLIAALIGYAVYFVLFLILSFFKTY